LVLLLGFLSLASGIPKPPSVTVPVITAGYQGKIAPPPPPQPQILVSQSHESPRSPDSRVLLVAVCSAPSHFEERQAIRQSWGKMRLPNQFSTFFFIGQIKLADRVEEEELEKKIADENLAHQDIVRLDSFIESYSNLTRKTLAMVHYAVRERFEVMLKVDDDSFVLLDRFFIDNIEGSRDRTFMYWGRFWGADDRPVYRKKGSKYYVSEADYRPDTFPNYADGPCYALGLDVMRYLDDHAKSLPLIPLEDAAVGIWLNDAPLPIIQIHGNAYMYARACTEGNDYYFVNPVTPPEMIGIMDKYTKNLDICAGNYTLGVCSSPTKGCLCSPSDHNCWDKQ
jgi:hypothetical protein